VDVHTDHAAYETQFGHVVRPTHENTTWDAARFEVCAHRWVQVGDGGYGVGLANDATYGHDVTRHPRDGGGTYSRVRLSLLRAPLFPDPETDQGRHVLRYALVPGAGIAGAAEAGYALNLPLRRRKGSPVEPLVRVEGTAYVEAVKLAEDGSGDVVVRLYEPLGARTSVRVVASFEHREITEVDLLERPYDTGSWDGETLTLRPFQIATLRYALAPGDRQLLDQPVGGRVVAGREVGEDGGAVVGHGAVLDGPPGVGGGQDRVAGQGVGGTRQADRARVDDVRAVENS
jgi:alpha-mannosidase